MCGIVGCITDGTEAPAILLAGLKRLEYRGYDSAGIAVLNGSAIRTIREVGKLCQLETALAEVDLPSGVGLGHTRWATHGRPTEVNAHPHRDTSGKIVVVHNGIIENFRQLRDELEKDGVTFTSETDSEIIAHLIARFYEGDLAEAVRLATRRLRGAWAIGAMHADHPQVLVGARKDCPLVVGVGEGEMLLASDVTAVLDRTQKVVFLDDGQTAQLTRTSLEITDEDGSPVDWTATVIGWSLSQAERGGFPHFMLKEIFEQPTVVSDTLLGRLEDDGEHGVLADMGMSAAALTTVGRIHIVACGTSWHAGHVAKFLIERIARIPVDVDYASEFRYREPVLGENDLVVAISQSGETADTIAALRMAKAAECRTLGICNVIGSTIQRDADGSLMTHAGPEIGVASTKAFTSQLTALVLLALELGRRKGLLSQEEDALWSDRLRALPAHIELCLKRADDVHEVALKYVSAQDFLFIGRGINYPIALEGALKLKEISYIHAEGYPAGEMKHGPIALVDAEMPIVALCTHSNVREKVITNVEEARVRDARVIVVANDGDDEVMPIADDILWVPRVDDLLSPIVNVVPLQLLSYFIARERGADVDQPRNLAKSVTVE